MMFRQVRMLQQLQRQTSITTELLCYVGLCVFLCVYSSQLHLELVYLCALMCVCFSMHPLWSLLCMHLYVVCFSVPLFCCEGGSYVPLLLVAPTAVLTACFFFFFVNVFICIIL